MVAVQNQSFQDGFAGGLQPFSEIANYVGRDKGGVLVGVALLERNGKLSELEAWSPSGADIRAWPVLSSLERAE